MVSGASEIRKLLKNWYFYKAHISSVENSGEIEKKLTAIERYIDTLDDVDSKIIRMRFFENASAERIAAEAYISRRAVFYRINKIVADMVSVIRLLA